MKQESGFKGLDISDMDFERTSAQCSDCNPDSCRTRDCRLELYKLGKDVIYSGGLCPKGNTNLDSERAPDYVKMYQKELDMSLSEFTQPLEQLADSPRVLIPRSLTFLNEKGLFYSSLYSFLGFPVSVSPQSDDEIANLGKANSYSEYCYPLILAHGHAAYLRDRMRTGLDKLLLVDAISCGKEKLKFCPYVASSGNLIMGNLGLSPDEILLPILYFNDSDFPIEDSVFSDLKRSFGKEVVSLKKVRRAVKNATFVQEAFVERMHRRGEEILGRLKEKGTAVYVGIGRGYTVLDDKASSNVHDLFAENGLHFIPGNFLDSDGFDVDSAAENMYWVQGRKVIASLLRTISDPYLLPVRLTNFNCGPDSILRFHEDGLVKLGEKPFLCLETDGHNSNAQFSTRIQAYERSVRERPRKVISINTGRKDNQKNLLGKIIGLPYMGDGSDIVAASLRAVGFNAEIMASRTPESLAISRKVVTTNTCKPFSYQVGDHIAWLESLAERGIKPENAAVIMAKTSGPCRFGQYSALLRKLFDEKGFEEVYILSPNSAKDYQDVNIPAGKIKTLIPLFFRGLVSNELLKNLLLRIRPYETVKGESDEAYARAHEELVSLTQKNPGVGELEQFLKEEVLRFSKIPRNDAKRRPLVLMNGEIFIRSHEGSNEESVRLLEANGLEVILEPSEVWMDYVNRTSMERFWNMKDFSLLRKSIVKRAYMSYAQRRLKKPFKDILQGRESHNPIPYIRAIENRLVFNRAIEGEGAISIGEACAFIDGKIGIDGIYHVAPLGCMQETVATSRIQALIQARRKISLERFELVPFMDAVFGDYESPNLESQVAIFAENCRLKNEMREK